MPYAAATDAAQVAAGQPRAKLAGRTPMVDHGVDVGLIAILVSVMAAAFAGYQAWIGAGQIRIQRAASELTFNLELMNRIDDVLLAIADRPQAHAHVWAWASPARPPQDYGPGHVLTQALIDILELAMQGTHRLPGFAVSKEGWGDYACEAFDLSAAIRQDVIGHPTWWPNLSRHLETARPEAMTRQTHVGLEQRL
jgi:hypothetical protein